jgi:FixJ family two-component response regulator
LTESFEEELRDGRAKFLVEQKQKKSKAKNAREAKKAAKEAALQKLTAEERKVLGI